MFRKRYVFHSFLGTRTIRTLANSDLCYFGPDSDLSCGQFGPLVNSDPAKSRSELANDIFEIGSDLAKVRIGLRSESANVRICLGSELTTCEAEMRSESANA